MQTGEVSFPAGSELATALESIRATGQNPDVPEGIMEAIDER